MMFKRTNRYKGGLIETFHDDKLLSEKNMISVFGAGEKPYEPSKGFGVEWCFKARSGRTACVYSRWGVMRVGGNLSASEYREFMPWLRAHLAGCA